MVFGIDEIILAGVFFIGAIIVQIVGVLSADWRTHKRRMEYMKQELLFNRKIKFLESYGQKMNKTLNFIRDQIETMKEGKYLTNIDIMGKLVDYEYHVYFKESYLLEEFKEIEKDKEKIIQEILGCSNRLNNIKEIEFKKMEDLLKKLKIRFYNLGKKLNVKILQ